MTARRREGAVPEPVAALGRAEFSASLRRVVEEGGGDLAAWVRDDDVVGPEPRFAALADLLRRHGMPLNAAVIPLDLKPGAAAYLRTLKRRMGPLLCLHQHGWAHRNHRAEGKKCEFGDERGRAAIETDVRHGMILLQERLGEDFHPAFTPPWNRHGDLLPRVVSDLGFRVFSRDTGGVPLAGYGFTEVSVNYDPLERHGAGWRFRPEGEVLAAVLQRLSTQGYLGLMLHHQWIEGDAWDTLDFLCARLAAHPAIVRPTFAEFSATGVGAAPSSA